MLTGLIGPRPQMGDPDGVKAKTEMRKRRCEAALSIWLDHQAVA
jgi:hypothetical protein